MFDTNPKLRQSGSQQELTACHIVRPWVSIRRPNPEEILASRVWTTIAQPDGQDAEVCKFSNGQSDHAPEVIAAYRSQAAQLAAGFTLVYLHRGAQPQCVNPLLPSFLYLTGHDGPSYALRRDGKSRLSCEVMRFARAITPAKGTALIVDDQQLRLAPTGRMRAAEVHFHLLCKPGLRRSLAAEGRS